MDAPTCWNFIDRLPPRLNGSGPTRTPMKPDEMKELAQLLQKAPGLRGIEFKEVKRLADLLREAPEIGSIELKGLFGTGVVITRTGAVTIGMPAAAPLPMTAPTGAGGGDGMEERRVGK